MLLCLGSLWCYAEKLWLSAPSRAGFSAVGGRGKIYLGLMITISTTTLYLVAVVCITCFTFNPVFSVSHPITHVVQSANFDFCSSELSAVRDLPLLPVMLLLVWTHLVPGVDVWLADECLIFLVVNAQRDTAKYYVSQPRGCCWSRYLSPCLSLLSEITRRLCSHVKDLVSSAFILAGVLLVLHFSVVW